MWNNEKVGEWATRRVYAIMINEGCSTTSFNCNPANKMTADSVVYELMYDAL